MSLSTESAKMAASDIQAGPRDWERLSFTASIAFYGATVGGCAILVNFLSRIQFPVVPQHMSFPISLFFGCVGAAVGALVAAPIAYWIFGSQPTFSFTVRGKRGPRGWIPWLLLGLGYALGYPYFLGVILPLVFRFTVFWEGMITVPELVYTTADLAVRALVFAFIGGFEYFFTGVTAALVFLAGAWIISVISSSKGAVTGKYGAWAAAILMSLGVAALLIYVPETILGRVGGLR